MYSGGIYEGISMILTLKKNEEILTVNFDFNRWDHDIFENGQHLGKTTLKELFKGGWVCVKREVAVK